MLRRIALVTTHPIQYQAPWFRALAKHPDLDVQIFFCHEATAEEQSAAGFGVKFNWDIPILDGYPYRFLKNVASHPSLHSFSGLDTPEIRDVISKKGFDAVIVNGWHYKSAWQAIRACWNGNTPIMVRSDSNLKEDRPLAKRILKWPYYRWFIPRLDACLAVGTLSKDYFLHYGANQERVFTVPHVIDDEFFSLQIEQWLPKRNALRTSWKLSAESIVFLFAGKFTEKKRPLDFLSALSSARLNGTPVEALMVGDGPLRRECEEFARTRDLPVSFAGFLNQSEITKAYVAADLLVLPSDGRETWGLVVNEAMLCGLPCIVSDRVGCGPDMISKDTGAIFPLGDQQALGNLISRMASEPIALKTLAAGARRKAKEHSIDSAVQGVLQAVERVG